MSLLMHCIRRLRRKLARLYSESIRVVGVVTHLPFISSGFEVLISVLMLLAPCQMKAAVGTMFSIDNAKYYKRRFCVYMGSSLSA
jgi:hypothetical protein